MRINNLNRAMTFFWTKHVKVWLRLDSNLSNESARLSTSVDIVIPCIPKDLETLPAAVESLRKNLAHTISNIFIVSPKSDKIVKFCSSHSCTYVDEESVFGFSANTLHYKPRGIERSGWLFQQLLKLSANKYTTAPYILLWDADTLLLKPQSYIRGSKIVLNHSDEFNLPYFQTYARLMRRKAQSKVSYVAHQLFITRSWLGELQTYIEKEHDLPWHKAVLDNIDMNETATFSEYELLGNFINTFHPEEYCLDYWFNISLPREDISNLEALVEHYAKKFKTASLHSYNRRNVPTKRNGS